MGECFTQRITQCMGECITQRITQCMGERITQCFTQCLGERITQRFTQCLGECFTQCITQCLGELSPDVVLTSFGFRISSLLRASDLESRYFPSRRHRVVVPSWWTGVPVSGFGF
jgi:hypothetical protein